MDRIHLSLSEGHAAFIEAQVASGRYTDADACVTALIHAAAKAWAQARLDALLEEGLRSPTIPWTPELMEEIRREAGLATTPRAA
jgi:Arc/MetJ-type ribon-helix-helix transcriptional regulator